MGMQFTFVNIFTDMTQKGASAEHISRWNALIGLKSPATISYVSSDFCDSEVGKLFWLIIIMPNSFDNSFMWDRNKLPYIARFTAIINR